MNHRMKFLSAAATCSVMTLALTGCGLGVSGDATKSTPVAAAHLIGGKLHGGQQAVNGATVTLWAAGVSGTTAASYGANATKIATTTSDQYGNFGFDNSAGVSPCTTGQLLYITATGGDSGSGANAQLAMMAALPTPCSSTTGSQFIAMNELTTVASVFALQQFMTITPGSTTAPWTIGAPSTNLIGLTNAFQTVGSMVNVNSGFTATSSTSNAVTNTVGGVLYTTIVNPDYTKINTLGDIIASCINSAGGAPCSNLFADVTPTGATTPTDTIEALYYLATNAAGLTMPAHGDAAGSPNYLCSTYVTASAPFQPTIACSTPAAPATTTPVPADWAIGVSFKTTNAAAATVATLAPGSIAIDANGNVWTATDNAVATGGSIAALNPTGQVVVAPVTTANISTTGGWYGSTYGGTTANQAFGGSRPNSIAIDTFGNSWTGAYYTTSVLNTSNTNGGTGGTNQAPIIEVSPAGVATGYLVGQSPGALTIDGNNNIFMSDITTLPGTSRYYVSELAAAGTTASTAAYSNFYTGTGRGTGIYAVLGVDQTTKQYVTPVSGTCSATLLQNNDNIESQNINNASTNVGANTITLSTATCIQTGVATDAKGNLWGTTGTYLEYIDTVDNGATPGAPIVTNFASGTGTTQGGLDGANNVAIDGLGNVWVANRASSTTGGVSEFTPTTTATGVTSIVAKSPAGTAVFGFGSTYAYSGPLGVAIDGSGNVWVETGGGSYLNEIVGAAAPVVTPNALSIKNGKIGLRP